VDELGIPAAGLQKYRETREKKENNRLGDIRHAQLPRRDDVFLLPDVPGENGNIVGAEAYSGPSSVYLGL